MAARSAVTQPASADEVPQVCNPHGLEFPFSQPQLIYEGALNYNQGEGELPGTLKVGGWRLFGSFQQTGVGDNGLPIGLIGVPGEPAVLTDHGFYAILDQMIYRMPGKGDPKGVSVFGRLMGAPADGNLIEFYWEGGLTLQGMLIAAPTICWV